MNKRNASIRSILSGKSNLETGQDEERKKRVESGAVSALKNTFSSLEKDNEGLRAQLEAGDTIIQIDPTFLDVSPFADRFEEQDSFKFEELKQSIREHGQEIPILVREHPKKPNFYQIAYGHRRAKVAKDLGIFVKACVKKLSDEELVLSQGVENSAREDLSFIERAMFSLKLERAGFARSVIQSALSVDRAEVSKLISVAQVIPEDIIWIIGRAPKAGRVRWMEVADFLSEEKNLINVRENVLTDAFRNLDTDQRFKSLLIWISKYNRNFSEKERRTQVTSRDGTLLAKISQSKKNTRLEFDAVKGSEFFEYLIANLPDIYESYNESIRNIDNKMEDQIEA